MSYLYNTIIYQPLFNGLVLLYEYIAWNDLGVAIILLTLVIRILFYPLFYKMFKNQTVMQKLQPELQRIQAENKNDKEKQAAAMMELYKIHGVNPFSSFLLIFIQLPILIALYQLFLEGFSVESLKLLYSFVQGPTEINTTLIGLIDLKEKSIIIVVLAAAFQYIQSVMSLPKPIPGESSAQHNVGHMMVWMGPLLTIVVLRTLPAAVGVYWLVSSVFSIFQQWMINNKLR